jgi:hypothetical protein
MRCCAIKLNLSASGWIVAIICFKRTTCVNIGKSEKRQTKMLEKTLSLLHINCVRPWNEINLLMLALMFHHHHQIYANKVYSFSLSSCRPFLLLLAQ